MDLPMSLILDLALGLVLLSILYTSWRRGFLASAIRLGGTVAGFLLASLVSRPAAAELYDRLVRDRVVEYVRGSLLAQGSALSQALEGTGQAGSALEAVAELLEEWGLDYFSSADAGALSRELLDTLGPGMDTAEAVAQVALRPMVMTVLELGVFLLVLLAVGLAVRLLAGMALGVNHIPVVGKLNRMAGLLCGGAYALLAGYLIAAGLVFLAGVSQNRWEYLNTGILRETWLIRGLLELREVLF